VIGSPPPTSPGWRRVAAFAVDYGVILAYLGPLALVGVLGRAVGVLPTEVTTPAARVAAQLAGIAVLSRDHRMTRLESPLGLVVPSH
jgi:hypothetical protein